MRNAEQVAHFQFVILASSLIRHSTFVLRHFTVRVHSWLTHEDSWNHWRRRS